MVKDESSVMSTVSRLARSDKTTQLVLSFLFASLIIRYVVNKYTFSKQLLAHTVFNIQAATVHSNLPTKLNLGKRAFSVAAPENWDTLPVTLKSSD